MKTLLCMLFLIAAAAAAADKPDFSGDWKMDAAKSVFGPMTPPTSMSCKIEQKEPDVSIVEKRSGDQGDQVLTYKYSTDGKETTNTLMGNEVKSKAEWDGDVLVVNSSLDAGGAPVKLVFKYSLSDGGKTLTEALNISAPQGDFEMTYVFAKQ